MLFYNTPNYHILFDSCCWNIRNPIEFIKKDLPLSGYKSLSSKLTF